jgi:hypothetical protein
VRQTAIGQGVPVTLLFDTAESRYWVIAQSERIITSGSLRLPPGAFLVSPARRATVRFVPTGAIASQEAISLQMGGRSIRVETAGWRGTVSRDVK